MSEATQNHPAPAADLQREGGSAAFASRIDFASVNAATFNDLRDQWRSAASGGRLSKAALRVAAVLPGFVNREFGYAFPTDEQLADEIAADMKTVKRGLAALAEAGLIDRVVSPKRGDNGVVIGKRRSIYLCLPTEGTHPPSPKGQGVPSPKGHFPKGKPVPADFGPKGQAAPKGQNVPTEGTPVCPYIPDTDTPDTVGRGSGGKRRLVYAREGHDTSLWSADDWRIADRVIAWQLDRVGDSRLQAEEFAHTFVERARQRLPELRRAA